MADEIPFLVIVPFASTLLGVVIGGVITYFASIKILERQQNIQKSNIAKAFLSEIKALENWVKPSIEDIFLADSRKENNFNLYHHAKDFLHWDRPFYEDTDLFFNSRMSMYLFDEDLYENLEKFYGNLLNADEYRQVFLSNENSKIEEITYHERKRYLETIEELKRTFSSVSSIKAQLEHTILIYGKKKNC